VASFQALGRRAEASDDKSKRAKLPAYPPTLGDFVGLGWRMQGLCVPCNGTDKFQVDMVAAAKGGKRFQPGNPGRPKGARNKLGEEFMQSLYADYLIHGAQVIERVREERPHEYLKVVASLLPKQLEIREAPFDGISDEELAALIVAARSALGLAEESGDGTESPERAQSLN
jgi:hypothetical protein